MKIRIIEEGDEKAYMVSPLNFSQPIEASEYLDEQYLQDSESNALQNIKKNESASNNNWKHRFF